MSPHSLQGLGFGLGGLDPAERIKITVIAGPASQNVQAAEGAEVVIADPPRKGLDEALVRHLIEHPPQRFLYVSCGLDSFLDDTARLTASGALRLSDLKAFNLMPFTQHVETVARFDRALVAAPRLA